MSIWIINIGERGTQPAFPPILNDYSLAKLIPTTLFKSYMKKVRLIEHTFYLCLKTNR